MNRSTCQHCGKKRYQDRMKMINPKSFKNGKPEWACLTCIDPKYVQVSAEPILFPNSARHFNGVLMEGEKCGICHHAHGREVCDECKAQILDCSGYGTATELDALEHKKWCADMQWSFYRKNPRKTTKVEYNELLLKSLEFKIGVLNERILELKKLTNIIIYDKPQKAVYQRATDEYQEKETTVIGEDNTRYIQKFTDFTICDTEDPNYGQTIKLAHGFHKSWFIRWVDEATDKKLPVKDKKSSKKIEIKKPLGIIEHRFEHSKIATARLNGWWVYRVNKVWGCAAAIEGKYTEEPTRQFATRKLAIIAAANDLKTSMQKYLGTKNSIKENYNQRTIKRTIEAIDMFLKLKNLDNL